jgi:hypothetical protein
MARTKFPPIPDINTLQHYAYFDPVTDQVFLVTNRLHPEYEHYALISLDDHLDLISGKLKLTDCLIDRAMDPVGGIVKHTLFTKNTIDNYSFNKSIVWVVDKPKKNTQIIVEWNKKHSQWHFKITPLGREILSGSLYDKSLIFFIMLETDLDFLIRTIEIKIHELVRDKVRIDFENKMEYRVKDVSIATTSFFKNYGLKIND